MSAKKLNIVIAGATGFVGLDLIKFLSNHPKVKIKYFYRILMTFSIF